MRPKRTDDKYWTGTKRLDEALDKETPETLNKWLEEKRK